MLIHVSVQLTPEEEARSAPPEAMAGKVLVALGGDPDVDTCYVQLVRTVMGSAGAIPNPPPPTEPTKPDAGQPEKPA